MAASATAALSKRLLIMASAAPITSARSLRVTPSGARPKGSWRPQSSRLLTAAGCFELGWFRDCPHFASIFGKLTHLPTKE
jgi:hypothetical protein